MTAAALKIPAALTAEQSAEVVSGTDHVFQPGRLQGEDTVIPSTAIPFCGVDVTEPCYSGEPLRVQAGYLGRDAAEPTIGVDDEGVAFMAAAAARFFAPTLDVVSLPAWDCLPYDRVSPNAAVSARRMATLARLASGDPPASRE